MVAIEIDGLAVSVGPTQLLRGLDARFPGGAISVVLGPSGAGKTTLLRTLAGLVRAARGAIRFDGRDVTATSPAERRVGMVFQDSVLLPHWSIERNIGLPLWARHRPAEEVHGVVRGVAARLGIEDLLGRRPREISGGQAQRVSIARALAGGHPVILLDEPFSALDERSRRDVGRDCVAAMRSTGSTAILVTHDQDMALGIADHLVVLSSGLVIQQGAPREIFECPANLDAARALGRPPMNFVTPADEGFRHLAGAGGILGFRPTDVDVLDQPDTPPCLDATLVDWEYRGSRCEARYRLAGNQFCTVEVGAVPTATRVFLALRRFHRFSVTTGERL